MHAKLGSEMPPCCTHKLRVWQARDMQSLRFEAKSILAEYVFCSSDD